MNDSLSGTLFLLGYIVMVGVASFMQKFNMKKLIRRFKSSMAIRRFRAAAVSYDSVVSETIL